MIFYGFKKIRMNIVRNTEFCSGFFYDSRNSPVMNMTNVRKKMMFDLIIKSSDKP